MKYTECPTTSTSVTVDAPASVIWNLVSDITLPSRFSTEASSADWLDGAAGPRLGARFRGHNAHDAIGEWDTTCEITGFEPSRLFEWSVLGVDDAASSIWRFMVEERPGGSVELTQWFQMGPARSGLSIAIDRMPDKEERIIARRLSEHRANMERTVAGIKQLAENAP